MKIERILCPIDYSPFSKAANFYASMFADAYGARIVYVNVLWPPNNRGPVEEQLDDLYSDLVDKIRPIIHGVEHSYEVRNGDPANQILDVAAQQCVDLIVMGTHGTTGLARLLHGSVCRKVLRNAKCPVMAVKDRINVGWVMPELKTAAKNRSG